MRRPDEEVRARQHLAMMVRMSGITHKDIDTELDWCRGTTSQVLKGRTELKMRHILDILDVCKVPSSMFFLAVFRPAGAAIPKSNLRWPEAGDVPFANMVAELTGFGFPPPEQRTLPPPEPDGAARLQQLFHELADRLPQLVALQNEPPPSGPRAPSEPAVGGGAKPEPKPAGGAGAVGAKKPATRGRRPKKSKS
ncbi:MAG TPA: hypothetical protein VGS22_15215 [Thermoanaerobaculia bacterium]|jgi:hypothetical protein|nr:hypothetical protein [Thermoanaerobaculia bacterium]